MKSIDDIYKEMVETVLNEGEEREDRTGVGTKSIFGYQYKYDLRRFYIEGPAGAYTLGVEDSNRRCAGLISSKRVLYRKVIAELLAFLRGETILAGFTEAESLWKYWAKEDGDLGPIYGKQMVNWTAYYNMPVSNFIETELPPDGELTCLGVAKMGEIVADTPILRMLKETWNGILKRCYSQKHIARETYKDVIVCNRWLVFKNFVEDVQKLENWNLKLTYPSEYSLDKDFYNSKVYSPETCYWASIKEQNLNTRLTYPFIAESPKGDEILYVGISQLVKDFPYLTDTCISNCLRGKQFQHKGWKFRLLEEKEGSKIRFRSFNQIKTLIANLKHNPSSRRLLVSCWNTSDLSRMCLTPCHVMFQCYVAGGKYLDLQMYQRSADLALGVPFNQSSYCILMHMLARETGLIPRKFIHTFGDLHIYRGHEKQLLDQVNEELDGRSVPWLEIQSDKSFWELVNTNDIDAFVVQDYFPLRFRKYEVAV